MKLVHPSLASVLEIGEGEAFELVVENQELFSELIEAFSAQIGGANGDAVLSSGLKILNMAKSAELLCEFAPFDLNRKTLLSKLGQSLERDAVSADRYLETQELLLRVETYLSELSAEYPCEVNCSKLAIGPLIRSVGIGIEDDSADIAERLYHYMELVREFDCEKLFIFVNLRSYLSDTRIEAFLRSAVGHDMKVLLLESTARAALPLCKRLTVDEDLCEF